MLVPGSRLIHRPVFRFVHGVCLGLCALLAGWLPGGEAVAQTGNPRIENVRIGIEGYFKTGRWTPVEFEVSGSSDPNWTPFVRAADPEGRGAWMPLERVESEESDRVRVRGLIRSGRLEAPLELQIRAGAKVVESRTIPVNGMQGVRCLRQDAQLWVNAAQDSPFVACAARWSELAPGQVHVATVEELGASVWSADVLDAIDLIAMDADVLTTSEMSEAMQRWVQRGGKLVISVGDALPALRASPLASWLPIMPIRQIELRDLAGINEAIPRSETLRLLLGSIPAAELDPAQGTVLVKGLGAPLVVRTAYGVGQITMTAMKTDQRPLSDWENQSKADFAALLGRLDPPWREQLRSGSRGRNASSFNPTGVSDLATQLLHAVDHFPQVQRPSHWVVMGWMALFALVVGPLDYFLMHHVLKRPSWTWGTLPLWIVLAALFGLSRGHAWNHREFASRQIDLVDLDVMSSVMRGRSWYAFYSPETQRRRITASLAGSDEDAARSLILRSGWIDRPEEGFQGMYRSGGVDDSLASYQLLADRSGVENLPTRAWASGSWENAWEHGVDVTSLTTNNLSESAGRLTGSISHHLPGELTHWLIAYRDFAYYDRGGADGVPTPLAQGVVWNPQQGGSSTLKGKLLDLTSPGGAEYDPLRRDPLVILRTATFHDLLGGVNYGGLKNQSLARMDLTPLLSLDRAVLFGRFVPQDAEAAQAFSTEFEIDGERPAPESREILVRMILPVTRGRRNLDAAPTPDVLKIPE